MFKKITDKCFAVILCIMLVVQPFSNVSAEQLFTWDFTNYESDGTALPAGFTYTYGRNDDMYYAKDSTLIDGNKALTLTKKPGDGTPEVLRITTTTGMAEEVGTNSIVQLRYRISVDDTVNAGKGLGDWLEPVRLYYGAGHSNYTTGMHAPIVQSSGSDGRIVFFTGPRDPGKDDNGVNIPVPEKRVGSLQKDKWYTITYCSFTDENYLNHYEGYFNGEFAGETTPRLDILNGGSELNAIAFEMHPKTAPGVSISYDDVKVFTPSDTVTATLDLGGQTVVPASGAVKIKFSSPVCTDKGSTESENLSRIKVTDSNGTPVSCLYKVSEDMMSVSVSVDGGFEPLTSYTVNLDGVKDAFGTAVTDEFHFTTGEKDRYSFVQDFEDYDSTVNPVPSGMTMQYNSAGDYQTESVTENGNTFLKVKKLTKYSDVACDPYLLGRTNMSTVSGKSNISQVKFKFSTDDTLYTSGTALGEWMMPLILTYGTETNSVKPVAATGIGSRLRTSVKGDNYTESPVTLTKDTWYTITYASVTDANDNHYFEAYLNDKYIGKTTPVAGENGKLNAVQFYVHQKAVPGLEMSFDDIRIYQTSALKVSTDLQEGVKLSASQPITVNFNAPVDINGNAANSENLRRIKIVDSSNNPVQCLYKVSDDLCTVTVTADGGLEALTQYKLVVDGVKDLFGATVSQEFPFETGEKPRYSYEENFEGDYSFSSLPEGFAINYPESNDGKFSVSTLSNGATGKAISFKKEKTDTDYTLIMRKTGLENITGSTNVMQMKVCLNTDPAISETEALGDWIQAIMLEYTGGESKVSVKPLAFTGYNAPIRTLVTGGDFNTNTGKVLKKGYWNTLTYASITDADGKHHFEAYINGAKIGETTPVEGESAKLNTVGVELHRASSKGQIFSFDDLKVYQPTLTTAELKLAEGEKVPASGVVTVKFNAPIDMDSLSGIVMKDNANAEVPYTASVSDDLTEVSLRPNTEFTPFSTYKLEINNVLDLLGRTVSGSFNFESGNKEQYAYQDDFDAYDSTVSPYPEGFAVRYPSDTIGRYSVESSKEGDNTVLKLKKVLNTQDNALLTEKTSGLADITGETNTFQVKFRFTRDENIKVTDALGDWIQPVTLTYGTGSSAVNVTPIAATGFGAALRASVKGDTYSALDKSLEAGKWYTFTYSSVTASDGKHHFEAYLDDKYLGASDPVEGEAGNLSSICFIMHRKSTPGLEVSYDDLRVYNSREPELISSSISDGDVNVGRRGTTVKLKFSAPLTIASLEKIKLYDEGNTEVPSDVVFTNNDLTEVLLSAQNVLTSESVYTIKMSGVSDVSACTMPDKNLSFTTERIEGRAFDAVTAEIDAEGKVNGSVNIINHVGETLSGNLIVAAYNNDTLVAISNQDIGNIAEQATVAKNFTVDTSACGASYYRLKFFVWDSNLASAMSADTFAVGDVPTLYIIGDSTAQTYDSGRAPLTGWGQEIGAYLDDGINIENCAVAGSSTRTFYDNLWNGVNSKIKKGDYLIIQFGHNDQMVNVPRGTHIVSLSNIQTDGTSEYFIDYSKDSNGVRNDIYKDENGFRYTVELNGSTTYNKYFYEEMLGYYIDTAREKGATPIIATSICERIPGMSYGGRSLEKTVALAKEVATSKNVPVLDVYNELIKLVKTYPAADTRAIYMAIDGQIPDNIHLKKYGATLVADIIRSLILKTDMPLAAFVKTKVPNTRVHMLDRFVNIASFEEDNGVWLPAEAAVAQLGGSGYSFENNMISFTLNGKSVTAIVGDKTALVDSVPKSLTYAPKLIGAAPMLHASFFGEALKFTVKWNESANLLSILRGGEITDLIYNFEGYEPSAKLNTAPAGFSLGGYIEGVSYVTAESLFDSTDLGKSVKIVDGAEGNISLQNYTEIFNPCVLEFKVRFDNTAAKRTFSLGINGQTAGYNATAVSFNANGTVDIGSTTSAMTYSADEWYTVRLELNRDANGFMTFKPYVISSNGTSHEGARYTGSKNCVEYLFLTSGTGTGTMYFDDFKINYTR